ncbi:MAG: response regulator [Myxococcales bacterium]
MCVGALALAYGAVESDDALVAGLSALALLSVIISVYASRRAPEVAAPAPQRLAVEPAPPTMQANPTPSNRGHLASGVVPRPELAVTPGVQTEEGAQHIQRLEVVGRLAGGIAHDFNNTLTVILSYGELMKTRLGPEHPVTELANHVVEAAEHGAALTKQLLTFTRRQVVKPRAVEVRQLLGSTERALARVIPRTIQVHRSQGEDELFVKLDALQLQQAVLNLVLNARDAMPFGGDLYLQIEGVDVPNGNPHGLLPGAYVVLRVRDTGLGIAPDVLPHIFEPFFTTKEPGRGTGLGLSNVREITEASGGHVTVQSELGRGSEFSLYFPRVESRPSGVQSRAPTGRSHRATLLVVDDEPQIREVIQTMLSEGGFLVKTAETGSEALAQLADEPVDLVCTDLVMPDMTGAALIDEVRKVHPRLPVVVCSAYGSDADVSRRVTSGDAWFLAKPFTRTDLLEVVERALAAQRKRVTGEGGSPLSQGN